MSTLILLVRFLAVYVVGVALLLSFNLWVLSLGDDKFAPPSLAFSIYFPLWLAFYSPVALLGGLVSSWPSPRLDSRSHWVMLRYFALLILGLFEITFAFDLTWQWILLEYLAISVCCLALRRHVSRAGRTTNNGHGGAIIREA